MNLPGVAETRPRCDGVSPPRRLPRALEKGSPAAALIQVNETAQAARQLRLIDPTPIDLTTGGNIMSGETLHRAADSGHHHVAPFVLAVAIAAATLALSLMLAGLPH